MKERKLKVIYAPRSNEDDLKVFRTKSVLSDEEIKEVLECEEFKVIAIVGEDNDRSKN